MSTQPLTAEWADPEVFSPGMGPEQTPASDPNAQYDAMPYQIEAGEQQKPVELNPFLIRMFLRAHGNKDLSKAFAGLLVADYASKSVIQYAEYNPAIAEMAYLEDSVRNQVAQSMTESTQDDNVSYPSFGSSRKRKGNKDDKPKQPALSIAA